MSSAAGAAALLELAGDSPARWAVVAGSGLAALAEAFEPVGEMAYADVPGFVAPSVEGHPGRLVLARAGAQAVWLCLGRPHFYEHGEMAPIARFVRTLADAGVRRLLITNAAGGVNPAFAAGDVMVIRDHLFLPGLMGQHPLVGANDPRGPRFPALHDAYQAELRSRLAAALAANGLRVHEGVYAMVAGPSYETPAEAKLLAALGADAVGMSTAPEVVVARHAGLGLAAVSIITNPAGAATASGATHDEVVNVSAEVAPRLGAALRTVVVGG